MHTWSALRVAIRCCDQVKYMCMTSTTRCVLHGDCILSTGIPIKHPRLFAFCTNGETGSKFREKPIMTRQRCSETCMHCSGAVQRRRAEAGHPGGRVLSESPHAVAESVPHASAHLLCDGVCACKSRHAWRAQPCARALQGSLPSRHPLRPTTLFTASLWCSPRTLCRYKCLHQHLRLAELSFSLFRIMGSGRQDICQVPLDVEHGVLLKQSVCRV
jgi:hypothetical protein